MTNAEFMLRLEEALRGKLPPEELEEVMRYHREYFAEAGEDAAARLDPPEVIARRILEEQPARPGRGTPVPKVLAAVICGVLAVAVGLGVRTLIVRRAADLFRPRQSTLSVSSDVIITGSAEEIDQVTAWDGDTSLTGEVLEAGPGIFHTIKIDAPAANVTVERGGDRLRVSLNGEGWTDAAPLRYESDETGGTILITGGEHTWTFGDSPGDIRISIPEGEILRSFSAEVGVGGISLLDVAAAELDLSAGVGSIVVQGGPVVCELDCKTGVGDISISGDFPCDVELESGTGSITAVFSTRAASDYSVSWEVGLGDFRINDEPMDGRRCEAPGGGWELDLKCGTGDVYVYFS